MSSRIVISDPHGCYNTLMALTAQLPSRYPRYICRRLIDRGSDSRKVIEFAKNGGYDCVIGNHEIMMLDELKFQVRPDGTEYVFTDYYHGIWGMNGGAACLQSYLIEKDGQTVHDIAVLKEHMKWLKNLPYYIEYKDIKNDNGQHLLVTHTTAADAWIKLPHDSVAFKNAVVWDRKDIPKKISGIYNVYGHTPQQRNPTVKDHFACIDGGAYYKRADYGRMFALQFPEMIIYEQKNIE